MIIHTDGPTQLDAGGDLDVEVGYHSGSGHKVEKVKGFVEETYEDTKTETVTLAVTEDYKNIQKTTIGTGQEHKVAAGGQKIGVAGGIGCNVDGGVTYNVGAGAEPAASEGPDFKVTVTGGDVKTYTDQAQELISNGAAKFQSETSTVDVLAKGAMNIIAEGPLTTRGATETVNILGMSFKDVKSDKTEFTHGFTKVINISGDLKFTASASANITLAAQLDLKAGVFVSATYSANFSFVGGCKAEINTVVDLRATPMKIQNAAVGFQFNAGTCFVVNTPTLAFLGAAFMSRAAIQLIN
jgi:hypothetical protein